MKCSEVLRILIQDGWFVVSQKGSHVKMAHSVKKGTLIFPDHGSQEMGKGMVRKIMRDAQILKLK